MKKIIIAMAAIAAAFTMASCSKEQPVSPEENATVGKSVVTASVENDRTKASLDADGNDTDGYKVFWSEGDKLFVADSVFEKWAAEYTLDKSSAGSSKGIFSWQNEDMFLPIDETYEGPVFEEEIEYMALYPSDFADMNSGAYIWKTEQTYTDMYIPMFAETVCTEEGTVDFAFTNLGGLLRLTVKGTAEIESITVTANEPMSGEVAYVMDDDEVNPIALMLDELDEDTFDAEHYITLDCKDGVELSSEGTDFYISIPCHYTVEEDGMKLDGYSNVSITLTDTEGRTCVKNLKNKNLVIERSKITTAAFTASEFKANVPEGALPGKFTINEAGDQVYFSQGNLWYGPATTGATKTFNFEANQYDSTPSSNGDWDASHVSHFFWSKNPSVAYAATYSDSSQSESDVFFTNANDFKVNVDGEDQTDWRTLSKDEWGYLFGMELSSVFYAPKDDHPRAGKFGLATVNSRTGLVLLPDSWNLPSGCSFTATALDGDCNVTDGEGFALNTYTLDQWSLMESAGAVFLPAAGYNDESYIGSVGVEGRYWSSSAYNNSYQAYEVSFISNLVCPDNYDMRLYGRSVRLITECQ